MNDCLLTVPIVRGNFPWGSHASVTSDVIRVMLGIDVSDSENKNLIRTPEGLFPVWQFHGGRLLPGLRETLTVLRGRRMVDESCAQFFLTPLRPDSPMAQKGWRTPLDALRYGLDVCSVLGEAMWFEPHRGE